MRDRIMRGLGTDEPWVTQEASAVLGYGAIAVHYRRPLRIDEINQLAPTAEVVARQGRA